MLITSSAFYPTVHQQLTKMNVHKDINRVIINDLALVLDDQLLNYYLQLYPLATQGVQLQARDLEQVDFITLLTVVIFQNS